MPGARCDYSLRRLCSPGTKKTGGMPVNGAKTTVVVVGVLGEDPLTCRILGLSLAGAGYEARTLEGTAVSEDPGAALAGVDLVLLAPGLGDERRGELVSAIRGGSATAAAVPALGLSSILKADPDEWTESWLPWPWTVEALAGAIERAVLAPAPGGGGEASSS